MKKPILLGMIVLCLLSCNNKYDRRFMQGSENYPGIKTGEIFLLLTYNDAYVDSALEGLQFYSMDHQLGKEDLSLIGFSSIRVGDTSEAYDESGSHISGMRPVFVSKEEYVINVTNNAL